MYLRSNPNTEQIYFPISLDGKEWKTRATGMIDSRAATLAISRKLVAKKGIPMVPLKRSMVMKNADNSLNRAGKVTHKIYAKMTIQGHTSLNQFLVTDIGDTDVIIGIDWMKRHNPLIDWEKETIVFPKCKEECFKKKKPAKGGIKTCKTTGVEDTEGGTPPQELPPILPSRKE